MNEPHVFTHSASCNDYTGCNDECGVHPVEECEFRNGAWRHNPPKQTLREKLDKLFGRGYMP